MILVMMVFCALTKSRKFPYGLRKFPKDNFL